MKGDARMIKFLVDNKYPFKGVLVDVEECIIVLREDSPEEDIDAAIDYLKEHTSE